MKRRVTIGAGVVLVIGMLIGMLSGLFRGSGEDGNGSQSNKTLVKAPINAAQTNEAQPDEPDTAPEQETTTTEQTRAAEILEILIDDRNYALRTVVEDEPRYEQIELPEIVANAKTTRGNEDGIRVRIFRRASARATAEELLMDELKKAGLAEKSIVMVEKLVE